MMRPLPGDPAVKVGKLDNGNNLKDDTGNVFGGGDAAKVDGNTSVKLQGSATVRGNVYGGGNNGPVTGSSNVSVQD